jgi:hypothetical protein
MGPVPRSWVLAAASSTLLVACLDGLGGAHGTRSGGSGPGPAVLPPPAALWGVCPDEMSCEAEPMRFHTGGVERIVRGSRFRLAVGVDGPEDGGERVARADANVPGIFAIDGDVVTAIGTGLASLMARSDADEVLTNSWITVVEPEEIIITTSTSADEITVSAGGTIEVRAGAGIDLRYVPFAWSVDDGEIVRVVEQRGARALLSGLRPGTTHVRVHHDDFHASAAVDVSPGD